MKRPALHAACLAFALLFRWLTPRDALLLAAAGCVFNLLFMPVLAPSLYRRNQDYVEGNATSGIFLYPVAILLLVAMTPLPIAAACWGILAAGDAAASVAGQLAAGSAGARLWPWHPRKTIAGSIAFAVSAFIAGSALWYWTTFAYPPWTRMAIAAVLAALVESLPLPIDDNLTVAAVSAAVFGVFAPTVTLSLVGVAISVALAGVAFALRLLTVSGAIAGAAIAALLYSFGGWQAFALLAAFFVIGSGATRIFYRRKQSMGLAERRRGARVAEQAVANAGAAVVFAFLGQPAAMAASLAAACADTIATEVGPLFGGRVFLLATGDVVPPGQSGGVSIAGSLAGIAASLAMASIAVATGTVRNGEYAIIAIAGVAGSLADSFLGGTLEKDGWLNNEGVNFLGTAVGGLVALVLLR